MVDSSQIYNCYIMRRTPQYHHKTEQCLGMRNLAAQFRGSRRVVPSATQGPRTTDSSLCSGVSGAYQHEDDCCLVSLVVKPPNCQADGPYHLWYRQNGGYDLVCKFGVNPAVEWVP